MTHSEERRLSATEAQAAMERWVRIAYEGGDPATTGRSPIEERGPTAADVAHSALLRRLLEGKEPFQEPPPRMYSYPAYQFAEGESIRSEVVFTKRWDLSEGYEPVPAEEVEPGGGAHICQGTWQVEQAMNEQGELRVRWPGSSWVGLLTPTDERWGGKAVWQLRMLEGPGLASAK